MADPYAGIATPVDPYASIARPKLPPVGGMVSGGVGMGSPGPAASGGIGGQIGRGLVHGASAADDFAAGPINYANPGNVLARAADATDPIANLMRVALGGKQEGPVQPSSPSMPGASISGTATGAFPSAPAVLATPPKGKAEQYARAMAEFVGASAAGGGGEGGLVPTLARTGIGAVSGAGSVGGGDIAGAVAKGIAPQYESQARGAGNLLGGTIPALALGAISPGAPSVQSQFSERLPEDMSNDQIAQIIQKLKNGENIGFPVTLPEATDTVTGGASKLTGLQQDIEGRPAGIDKIGPMMAQRPAKGRAVLAQVLDQLGPEKPPAEVSLGAQGAAEGMLKGAERARTAATGPMYQAADAQPVDLNAVSGLLSDIDAKIASDKSGLLAGQLKGLRSSIAATGQTPTIGDLSPVAEHYSEEASIPLGQAGGLSSRQSGILGNYAGKLADILNANEDHAGANATYANISANTVDPLYAGPIGKIAKPYSEGDQPSLGAQANALYPQQPYPGQPQITGETVPMLGQSGADLTRAYLGQQGAEQMGSLASGENQFGPGRFATAVAGNPLQKETLMAGVNSASPAAGSQLASALDAFGTSRARLGVGSNTVNKLDTALEVAGERAGIAGAAGAAKNRVFQNLLNVFNDLGMKINQSRLADAIMTNSEGAGDLLRSSLAAKGNTSLTRGLQQAATAFIGSGATNEDGQ